MEEHGQSGMQGVFGILLVVGSIVLVVLILNDLAGGSGLGFSGLSSGINALGQYNPAGAAKTQPPGSSVGLPVNGNCPSGSINLGGVCTVIPSFSVGTLPPTAAPGSGTQGTLMAGRGTPGGCLPGYHSAVIGGRTPGCVRD